MRNPVKIIKLVLDRIRGTYKCAVRDGMQVGKGVSIMGRVDFGSEPYLITLDDEVRVSFGVTFVTHDGGTWAFRDAPEYSEVIKYGRIHVGKRTFIGCNSTVMPGVNIGEHCVVGAGSVVTNDIPDGCVAVGVPAKVIMTTDEYAKKCKANMKPYDVEAYNDDKKSYLQKWL